MFVIGLSGKIGSGKDTVCEMIAEAHPGAKFLRIAFADALKEEVATACGVAVDYLNQNKPLFRPMLQWWGTEFRRAQDADYWIGRAAAKMAASDASLVIVTDVRFVNEAQFVRGAGGMLVRVHRPGCAAGRHSSETIQDGFQFDLEIVNSGTLEQLRATVDDASSKLLPVWWRN